MQVLDGRSRWGYDGGMSCNHDFPPFLRGRRKCKACGLREIEIRNERTYVARDGDRFVPVADYSKNLYRVVLPYVDSVLLSVRSRLR